MLQREAYPTRHGSEATLKIYASRCRAFLSVFLDLTYVENRILPASEQSETLCMPRLRFFLGAIRWEPKAMT